LDKPEDQRMDLEDLLVLWSPIPSTGIDNLYERLFLTRSVLALYPDFDDNLGRYLPKAEKDGVKIIEHVDAVRQALQLSAEDVARVLAYEKTPDALLSIATLSTLMRYRVLAELLDLEIAELIVLLGLSRRKPLRALDQ